MGIIPGCYRIIVKQWMASPATRFPELGSCLFFFFFFFSFCPRLALFFDRPIICLTGFGCRFSPLFIRSELWIARHQFTRDWLTRCNVCFISIRVSTTIESILRMGSRWSAKDITRYLDMSFNLAISTSRGGEEGPYGNRHPDQGISDTN